MATTTGPVDSPYEILCHRRIAVFLGAPQHTGTYMLGITARAVVVACVARIRYQESNCTTRISAGITWSVYCTIKRVTSRVRFLNKDE